MDARSSTGDDGGMTIGQRFPPGDYRFPEQRVDAGTLLGFLQNEPTPAINAALPRYVFRGQTDRYERRWPPEDRSDIGIAKEGYLLDSLPSSTYRGLEREIADDPTVKGSADFASRYGTRVEWVRHVITYAAVWLRARETGDGHTKLEAWLTEQVAHRPLGQRMDKLGSIGQHYGLGSGYFDATADPSVAAWFATHRWDGSHAGDGESVIYRFDTHVMAACKDAYADSTGRRGHDAMRHVDIRDTPVELAPRAVGQAGLSLISYDNPFALCALRAHNGVLAFRFVRSATAPVLGVASAARIKPPGDRLPYWFDQLRAVRGYRDVVQKLVDELLNVDLPQDQQIVVDPALWEIAWEGYVPTSP